MSNSYRNSVTPKTCTKFIFTYSALPQSKPKHSNRLKIQRFCKALNWIFLKRISCTLMTLKSVQFSWSRITSSFTCEKFMLFCQKKFFTNKLWAYYKIKHCKAFSSFSATLVTQKSITPRNDFSPFSTSHSRSSRKTILLGKTHLKLNRFCIILSRVAQLQLLKSFWEVYLCKSMRRTGIYTSKMKRLVDILMKMKNKKKKWAFIKVNSENKISRANGFLAYLVSQRSIKAGRALLRFINEKKLRFLDESFQSIQGWHNTQQKLAASREITITLTRIQQKLKYKALLVIKYTANQIKLYQRVNFSIHRLGLLVKSVLKYSFLKIRAEVFAQNTKIQKIFKIVSAHHLKLSSFAFISIKKSRSAQAKRRFTLRLTNFLIALKTFHQKALSTSFLLIKSYSHQTYRISHKCSFKLHRLSAILTKSYLLKAAISLAYIKKFSKCNTNWRSRTIDRGRSPRIITLPTIFLQGDPGGPSLDFPSSTKAASTYRRYP